ncbi:fimbrial protein [Cronobacter turicensis]|uniref:fimbrial protein n=1 Tax=Cronobacter turicensis TaxID=413502 RepID=UPI0024C40372|nr:fimbrial protein [Cronobacter turicensis]MDK1184080.1 fimbrial protein [Cronobacter turicensis]MDK1204880.1 fimbrial protein [Cronobacter turicensis]MDK1213051.1 fimbrial protein [Cronobacter turicensis]MDK1218240.1 fimbrial protein [Cronobacter turicensis]MDK1232492.1 fimbrial protein [Cronobacter turicensis]
MKKKLTCLVFPALLLASSFCAEASTEDQSATLSISGAVVADADALCNISAKASAIYLRGDISNLINLGEVANNMTFVPFTIQGNEACVSQLKEGRFSYKFVGVADSIEGKALANASEGDSAAQGVAIGLFDDEGRPIDINHTVVLASQNRAQGIGFQVVKLNGKVATAGTVHGVLTIDVERL